MKSQYHERLLARLKRFVGMAAAGSGLIGGLALLGWIFDLEPLKRIAPGMVAMNPATAMGFILAGTALWLLRQEPDEAPPGRAPRYSRRVHAAHFLASLVVLLGALKFSRYLTGWDTGVDQWFFTRKLIATEAGAFQNRMAPNTALAFIFCGVAMLILDVSLRGRRIPAQYLALAAVTLAWVALVGYGYGTGHLYGVASHIPMALNTAAGFLLLGGGILCARPGGGIIGVVFARETGGIMARRMLPLVVVLPALLGWGRLAGERAGFFDAEMGVALMVASTGVLLGLMIWLSAERLNRIDFQRQAAERQVRDLNEQLAARASQLEEANKELESFSYSVSHDLRAPLRHISGFVDLLRREIPDADSAPAGRHLAVIDDAARQMGRLIDDLLSLSRNSRTELAMTQFDAAGMVRSVVEELSCDTPSRSVDWRIHPLPEVSGDAALLRTAWVNLISNALKYTRPRAEPRIEIGFRRGEREFVFFVRDNGVGFDMKYIDKLFGVFQRLHHADEFEGTGVGLANVRRIIVRHGGRVWAEGKKGEGATFFFTLPAADSGDLSTNPQDETTSHETDHPNQAHPSGRGQPA